MTNLKTDSPLSRRIARSFLQFLNSVEPSAGVDSEALDVARECLAEVFKIDQSSLSQSNQEPSLIDIFNLNKANATQFVENEDMGKKREPHPPGKDELCGNFFDALEKINYFRSMSDGTDDQTQLDRTTLLFHNAMMEMEETGCQTYDQKTLGETFKSQGNRFMQSKRYFEAIELYTFAVAQCEDNAVYYCNRAAAYTQIQRYAEAIRDCLKSIEINPNYTKAYSRLGFAYYALGKYRDAIDKGFMKALQLDPNNDSIKENIRVAEQKLKEARQRGGSGQGSTSTSHEPFNHQPQSSSIPFNIINNGVCIDIVDVARNMVPQDLQSGPNGGNEADDDINAPDLFEFGEATYVFAGPAAPGGNQQGNNNQHGRPSAS